MSERDAWNEYLAWTRGADPDQYEITEQLAWQRLQRAQLVSLPPLVIDDELTTPELWSALERDIDLDQGV